MSIPLRLALRNWLLQKLAGKSPVMINCRLLVGYVEPGETPQLRLYGYAAFMSNCDTTDLQQELHEEGAELVIASRDAKLECFTVDPPPRPPDPDDGEPHPREENVVQFPRAA